MPVEVIAHEISQRLPRALGEAVVRIWGHLPHDVQHQLFEDVVTHEGETTRLRLAILLHEMHPRTCASMRARAVLEPDSLGG
jgi:hypothetical protein